MNVTQKGKGGDEQGGGPREKKRIESHVIIKKRSFFTVIALGSVNYQEGKATDILARINRKKQRKGERKNRSSCSDVSKENVGLGQWPGRGGCRMKKS